MTDAQIKPYVPHRIDIEKAVSGILEGAGVYLDTEVEATLLATIYGWRDEALTDARRTATS